MLTDPETLRRLAALLDRAEQGLRAVRQEAMRQAAAPSMPRHSPVIRHFRLRRRLKETGHERHSLLYCLWMNLLHRPRCGYGCRWIAPFGLVVDADCPEHDLTPPA